MEPDENDTEMSDLVMNGEVARIVYKQALQQIPGKRNGWISCAIIQARKQKYISYLMSLMVLSK